MANRGVAADLDGRFGKNDRKLLEKLKFPKHFSKKVDMRRVHLDVMRPWITRKVTQYVGVEDDILISMVVAELEKDDYPDPRQIQVAYGLWHAHTKHITHAHALKPIHTHSQTQKRRGQSV